MGVNKPRKENYANFYKTYDADKEFERMKVGTGSVQYSIVQYSTGL